MYRNSQNQSRQQNQDNQSYNSGNQYQESSHQHYQSDQNAKERFDKWKRQKFTSFDQQSHDEFLRDRYQRTFYKYANAQNSSDQGSQYQQDFEQSFNAKNHFSNTGAQRPYPSTLHQKQKTPQSNQNIFGFRHNSRILAFLTNRPYRTKLLDFYHDEILLQEITIVYYFSGIMIVGIFFNVGLYYYLQMRKKIRRNEQLHEIMDSNAKTGKIYVDQKFMIDNDASMEDLQCMYDQPGKFALSNHLRNKVLKERSKQQKYHEI